MQVFCIILPFFFSSDTFIVFHNTYIYTLIMTRNQFIGAIDQGTTSTRFVIFDQEGKLITYHQMEFEQHYMHPGYVIQKV